MGIVGREIFGFGSFVSGGIFFSGEVVLGDFMFLWDWRMGDIS